MGWLSWILQLALLGLGAFMILLVLLQRGRGGGLVGALGGPGGQSAFGTRAGDVFTKITVVVATLWVVTAGFAGMALRRAAVSPINSLDPGLEAPAEPDALPVGEPIDDSDIAPVDDAAPAGVEDEAGEPAAETPKAEVETLEDPVDGAEPSEGEADPAGSESETAAETDTEETPGSE